MKIDPNSAEWRNLKEHINDRIKALRIDNDEDLNKEDTVKLRGKIEFAKEILSLGEDEEKVLVQDQTYLDEN